MINKHTAAILLGAIMAASSAASHAAQEKMAEAGDVGLVMEASPVALEDLGNSRGAFSPDLLNLNYMNQNASSSNNVNVGGVTGNNNVSNGAFNNTQGLVNVIQNSGNNVVIQSSTIVNMTMLNN